MGRVLWKYKSESALPLSERQPVCADGINDGNMAAMRTAKERERTERGRAPRAHEMARECRALAHAHAM